jgi:hypothetical protein
MTDHVNKWKPILEHADYQPIRDAHRRKVTATLLENQMKYSKAGGEVGMLGEDTAAANTTGPIAKYDPILINLVRRAMPNLIAYDICGVQPLTGPSGLVFAYKPKYIAGGVLGDDAFYKEADTDFSGSSAVDVTSGAGVHAGTDPSVLNQAVPGVYTYGTGKTTAAGEILGTDTNPAFGEMGFDIDSFTVQTKTRALKATYTVELAQDLKQIHGLDAETELSNILSAQLLADLNREIIRTVYVSAKIGAQNVDLTTAGIYDLDTDSNGRWSKEKFQGMLYQIEREANQIAKETRMGKGNFVICSSDVASALGMSGMLDYQPALSTDLQVDDTGNTFAGVLNGRYRVYVDPYATGNFFVVGYKGANAYDAGIYYCPYIPLQMYKAVSEDSFQPKIGFKTRYAVAANPFSTIDNNGNAVSNGLITVNANVYYRRVRIENLAGAAT